MPVPSGFGESRFASGAVVLAESRCVCHLRTMLRARRPRRMRARCEHMRPRDSPEASRINNALRRWSRSVAIPNRKTAGGGKHTERGSHKCAAMPHYTQRSTPRSTRPGRCPIATHPPTLPPTIHAPRNRNGFTPPKSFMYPNARHSRNAAHITIKRAGSRTSQVGTRRLVPVVTIRSAQTPPLRRSTGAGIGRAAQQFASLSPKEFWNA